MNLPHSMLEQCRSADLMACDPDTLVDLQDIHIDTSRSLSERMEEFVNQVGNPYLMKVDGLVIKAVYLPDSKRKFSEAIASILMP